MSSELLTPSRPLDIVHAILERFNPKIHRDYATLSACSRVCRNWLPIARRYLFAYVRIIKCHDDMDYLREGRELFHDQFIKPFAVNPAHVTDLNLVGALHSKLDSHQLAAILSSFPLLKQLYINNWSIGAVGKPHLPNLYPSSLEVLRLRDLIHCPPTAWQPGSSPCIPPETFLDLLHHFQEVKSVIFHYLPFAIDGTSEELDFSHLDVPDNFAPSSVSLPGAASDSDFFLNLFCHTPSIANTLRTLHIAFVELVRVAPFIGRFLDTARRLEVLRIDVFAAGYFHVSDYNLTHDTLALQSVKDHLSPIIRSLASLRTLVLIAPSATSKYWLLCIEILSSLPATLRHVELRMNSESPMELPLEQLGDRLSGVEVAKVVLFNCSSGSKGVKRRAAWSRYLHRGLPDLANRKILQVWFSMDKE